MDAPEPSLIWEYPPQGKAPDLGWLHGARDLASLTEASFEAQEASLDALEKAGDKQLDEAHRIADELKAQGINFDVDRIMRGSLWERILIKFDDIVFAIKDRFSRDNALEGATAGSSSFFAFSLALGITRPTNQLPHDYEVIEKELDRFRAEIASPISKARGQKPLRPRLSESVMDGLYEEDDWSDDYILLDELTQIVAYWPPKDDMPALALSEQQHDGGLPIEVFLLAQDATAHSKMLSILTRYGGQLK